MRTLTFTQLHEGNHCLLTQPSPDFRRPFTLNGKGAEEGHCEGQEAGAHQPSTQSNSKAYPICRQREGETSIPQHKEQVWSQPANSHPWQTQERKWKEAETKVVFIICGGMSMRNHRGSWAVAVAETPPLAVTPLVKLSAPWFGIAPHGPASLNTHALQGHSTGQVKGTCCLPLAGKTDQVSEETASYT